jgi:MutS domain V
MTASPDEPGPRRAYDERLRARRAALGARAKRDALVAHARLGTAVAAAVMGWLVFADHAFSAWWLTAPVVSFLGVVQYHDRVIRARDAAAAAIAFYERGIARLEDRWAGGGEPGLPFADDEHPYAADLDLFGRGSLFELLSIARTHAGEATLASWLLHPATALEVRARQGAVAELTPRLDFRETLALAGAEARTAVNTAALESWAGGDERLSARWPALPGLVLSAATIAAIAWWAIGGPVAPLVVTILGEVLFARAFQRRTDRVLRGSDFSGLEALAHVLEQIEHEPLESPRLSQSQKALRTGPVSASTALRRLHRLLVIHDWRLNLIFTPVAGVLLWPVQFAWAFDSWRRSFGHHVPAWTAAAGELEAFSSLATYAWEHPADPFPDLVEQGPASFDGTALGHPLIPSASMVYNDVRLTPPTRLLIVSGSNMSGKSTLLRTVGVNAVLALAGAPVRARRLALTPLDVGGTLRIQDSLQAGRSRFYAEITRIRDLSAAAASGAPLLFLFDELLQGTNSQDRLVGAVGVLRSLMDRGAIGLVTTHDLALTAIAEQVGSRAVNVHFEDRIEAGQLAFDYRMRPGPVTHGNGLALMKAVGLSLPS